MAVESIGALYPTKIPGYADAADIQAALRAYHYGSYSYNTANTSPASLEAGSIAKFLYDIETDIAALEARPSSGGNAQTTQPAPAKTRNNSERYTGHRVMDRLGNRYINMQRERGKE